MKRNLFIIIGLLSLGLSGCLIGADPLTFKNDADPDATVQTCFGGTAESSNGLCWREAVADGIRYGELDKNTICQLNDGTGDWRLPSTQEFIRLLGNCVNDDEYDHLLDCDSCGTSPICSLVFPNHSDSTDYSSYYSDDYLTSDGYLVDLLYGEIVDRLEPDAEKRVKIMCVRPESI